MATFSFEEKYSIVFFDLELTGLNVTDDITQIAAKCGSATYNKYVVPRVEIPEAITELTGIRMTNNQMYCHGKPVDAVSQQTAAKTFIDFLRNIGGQVILVAQNCFKSDGPMLAEMMIEQGMIKRFKEIVGGFSDSLPLLRKCLPAQRKTGKGYKLIELAQEFLGSSSGAHDAIEDVRMLEKLILHEKISITDEDIIGSRQIVGSMMSVYHSRLKMYRQCHYRYQEDE